MADGNRKEGRAALGDGVVRFAAHERLGGVFLPADRCLRLREQAFDTLWPAAPHRGLPWRKQQMT